mmetsp:Transcript_15964/g.13516  ORF Transcript_15964/g.13516 Transcript_15964/m.13516 type:complete len:117 (-) Transcript_15964:669-1019(-)
MYKHLKPSSSTESKKTFLSKKPISATQGNSKSKTKPTLTKSKSKKDTNKDIDTKKSPTKKKEKTNLEPTSPKQHVTIEDPKIASALLADQNDEDEQVFKVIEKNKVGPQYQFYSFT